MKIKSPEKFKNIFNNQSSQKEFNENGFVIQKGLSIEVIMKLESLFEEFWPKKPIDFAVSHFNEDFDQNKVISDSIISTCKPFLMNTFVNYKTIIGHFLNKPSLYEGKVELHRDWSYVDEKTKLAVQVWIPLQPTTKNNGGLFVIPKTHKDYLYRSASYGIDFRDFDEHKDKVEKVDVNLGQVICYHPGILHGSYSNKSDKPRKAILISLTNNDASVLYFEKNKSGLPPTIKKINPDFFLKNHFLIQKEYEQGNA